MNVLNLFTKITLDEMNKVKLMDRIETKFLLTFDQLPAILDKIREDYFIVSIEGNIVSEYKTVYFDTDKLFFFNEHQRKRKDRFKVRFRNYVDSDITFLEVKHKKNGRVDKKRIEVENEVYSLNSKNSTLLIESNLDHLNLKEQLSNNYNRITLVSKHNIERVTFDFNVRFMSESAFHSLNNLVIAELKQEKLSRTSPIYRTLKKAHVKPYSVSKYCIGLIKTKGLENLKYNRFKKKLLQIEKITRG